MLKRRVFVVVSVLLVFVLGLTSCKKNVGSPEDNAVVEEPEEDQQEEIQEEILVGFTAIDMENPYFITLESAIRGTLEEAGYQMITRDPGTDPKLQETQIQEMIDAGIDVIIISPVDWEKITPSLEKLKEADVKIVNVDTQVREMDYVDAYIGSDNHNAGFICGEGLIEKCPDGGKIAILECPTQNSINDRITGFEEAIARAENGFEVVERVDTGGEFEKALEASQRILEEYPDICAIMCGNDQLAVGAKTAANVAGLTDVVIYGVDGSPDIKKELKKAENQIAGTAAQSPINMGKKAAVTVMNILKGEDYEKEVYEEVFMINKDNVDMYGTDGWQ
ncbi:sugar ABC transporter substrate-binding protein [Lachnospiraceae bacterium 50-23]